MINRIERHSRIQNSFNRLEALVVSISKMRVNAFFTKNKIKQFVCVSAHRGKNKHMTEKEKETKRLMRNRKR